MKNSKNLNGTGEIRRSATKKKERILGGEFRPHDPWLSDFLLSLKIPCVLQRLSQGLPKKGRMAAQKGSREASSGVFGQPRGRSG